MSLESVLMREARELLSQKLPGYAVSTLTDAQVKAVLPGVYAGGWDAWVSDYQRLQLKVTEKSAAPSIYKQVGIVRELTRDWRFRWNLRVHESWESALIEDNRCILRRRVADTKEGVRLDHIQYSTEMTVWERAGNRWERTQEFLIPDSVPSIYRKF